MGRHWKGYDCLWRWKEGSELVRLAVKFVSFLHVTEGFKSEILGLQRLMSVQFGVN